MVAGHTAQKEVDTGQQVVSRSDCKGGPSGPDGTSTEQCKLLGSGDFLDGSLDVVEAGDDQAPLQDWRPEVDGSWACFRIEEARELGDVWWCGSHGTGGLKNEYWEWSTLIHRRGVVDRKCGVGVGPGDLVREEGREKMGEMNEIREFVIDIIPLLLLLFFSFFSRSSSFFMRGTIGCDWLRVVYRNGSDYYFAAV